MTLCEAIKRYTDNAEYERTHGNLQGCMDFKQLAEWLRKYQKIENIVDDCDLEAWEILEKIKEVVGA
jgi:predicted molibdopterin-dependent oxidoreductase YjgC